VGRLIPLSRRNGEGLGSPTGGRGPALGAWGRGHRRPDIAPHLPVVPMGNGYPGRPRPRRWGRG
jgi:hypothetical protein